MNITLANHLRFPKCFHFSFSFIHPIGRNTIMKIFHPNDMITKQGRVAQKPKFLRFSNFEQFWNAKIILHWNHFKHFFLNLCLKVANLIWFLALSQKRTMYFRYILFCGNVITHYHKRECTWNTLFSFGLRQNFRSNSRPLNTGLEKNA